MTGPIGFLVFMFGYIMGSVVVYALFKNEIKAGELVIAEKERADDNVHKEE